MFAGARLAINMRVFKRLLNIKNQNERIIQHRGKSWAVIGDVGEHGPAIELRVFERLLNIKNQYQRIIEHREKSWAVFGGAWPSNRIESF